MIKISCCPNFKIFSFVTLKILVDLTLYVLLLISAGLNQSEGSLLSPKQSALFYFGEKFPYYIKEFLEVYRLITSLFLNVNIIQLLTNIAGQMIYGSFVEKFLGMFKTLLVFLLFGVGGCLFSCIFKSEPQIDASSSTMGFIGFQAGVLLIYWDLWDYPSSGRYQMSLIIILGMIVNFTLGFSYDLIDNFSMAASFALGVVLSVAFMNKEKAKKRKAWKFLCCALLGVYFAVTICVFAFYVQPKLI